MVVVVVVVVVMVGGVRGVNGAVRALVCRVGSNRPWSFFRMVPGASLISSALSTLATAVCNAASACSSAGEGRGQRALARQVGAREF